MKSIGPAVSIPSLSPEDSRTMQQIVNIQLEAFDRWEVKGCEHGTTEHVELLRAQSWFAWSVWYRWSELYYRTKGKKARAMLDLAKAANQREKLANETIEALRGVMELQAQILGSLASGEPLSDEDADGRWFVRPVRPANAARALAQRWEDEK